MSDELSRQQKRLLSFRRNFAILKEKHGAGQYSWAEGMTRNIARKIARDVANHRLKISSISV